VVIGCDGVNSVVAKWLGFKKPSLSGRSAIRGCAYYEAGHGFEPKFQQFMGHGVRYGIVPCDDTAVYWFLTWSPSPEGNAAFLCFALTLACTRLDLFAGHILQVFCPFQLLII